MRRILVTGLLSLAVMLTASPASSGPYNLPDIGDPSASVISPSQEQAVGRELLRRLRAAGRVVDDPLIQDYVESLGFRLVANSDDPAGRFTFFVIRSGEINAFAAPGGYIGVNAGLILTTEAESELAAVLAHEIAHITQRHMARTYEAAERYRLAAVVAVLAAALIGQENGELGEAAAATGSAAAAQLQLNFTRANEREADRVGMQTLADSGFNPESMATFFERMQRATRLYGVRLPEFLSSHPVTPARIADSRSRAAQLQVRTTRDNRNYELMRARLQVLTASDPAAAEKQFAENLASGNFHNEAAARYGYAVALLNNRKYEQARKQIRALREQDPERIPYLVTHGRIEMAGGNLPAAIDTFEQALLIYPHNYPLTTVYAEGLLRANKPREALQLLQDYLRNRSADTRIHRLLAQAAGDAGEQAQAYRHMAEYYYLNGDTRAAIEQLTQASRLKGLDYYESATIQARLKELKQHAALTD